MLSFNDYITEQRESKQLDDKMSSLGYGRPKVGTEGHITFTNREDPNDQFLVDVPGKEWHHMTKGVVDQKGSMTDDSLDKYVS
jgi:hypothetical protein